MQPVVAVDELRARRRRGSARAPTRSSAPGVEGDEPRRRARSRAFRARDRLGRRRRVRLEIDKRIPVAAGMAGGSADAAAALRLAARAAGRARRRAAARARRRARRRRARAGAPAAAAWRPAPASALRALPRPARRSGCSSCRSPHAALDRRRLPRGRPARAAARRRRARGAQRRARRGARARRAAAAGRAAAQRPRAGGRLAAARARRGRSTTCAAPAPTHALVCGSGPTVVGLFADLERARAAAVALSGRDPRAGRRRAVVPGSLRREETCVKIWPFVAAAVARRAASCARRKHLEPPLLVGGVLIVDRRSCVYGSGARRAAEPRDSC